MTLDALTGFLREHVALVISVGSGLIFCFRVYQLAGFSRGTAVEIAAYADPARVLFITFVGLLPVILLVCLGFVNMILIESRAPSVLFTVQIGLLMYQGYVSSLSVFLLSLTSVVVSWLVAARRPFLWWLNRPVVKRVLTRVLGEPGAGRGVTANTVDMGMLGWAPFYLAALVAFSSIPYPHEVVTLAGGSKTSVVVLDDGEDVLVAIRASDHRVVRLDQSKIVSRDVCVQDPEPRPPLRGLLRRNIVRPSYERCP